MSFADEWREVERQALVENTAQDVFNNLKDLESQASLHASRWIWELLQNARDAAPADSRLHIRVCFSPTEVTFQHNGLAFTKDQVAHLIHHGSTKSQEEGLVGRFGTGFLSSHIISRVPMVSGHLNDGQKFAFVLDRTGSTPKELTASMERSSQEFVRSVSEEPATTIDHSTKFVYPLTPIVEAIAKQGVESLEIFAPYVLVFNQEIESIDIMRDGKRRIYQRQASSLLDASVQLTPIEVRSPSDEVHSSFSVASVTAAKVTVAVVAKQIDGMHEVQFDLNVPRLFLAFPLFGTESIGFPCVVNSRHFCPKKDRDGLYLSHESTDFNSANKALIEQACPLFLQLMKECAKSEWKGIDRICRIDKSAPLRGVDEKWLHSLIKTALVEKIRETALVRTCDGQLITPENAQIPIGSQTVQSNELWQLINNLSDSETTLVEEVSALAWEDNLRGWATVLETSPEQMHEGITTEKCARTLAAFGSLDQLRQALRPECDPITWCNILFDLLLRTGQATLFDTLALLPNQKGTFQNRNNLNLDIEIDEQLKDIGELLEFPIRTRLLHKDIATGEMSKLLPGKSQADLLVELGNHLRSQAQKDKQVSGFQEGNVRLFGWILRNASVDDLESFPALTQESYEDGEAVSTIILVRDTDADIMPLAPPECWPKDARAFSELFPSRHMLSSAYYTECPDEALWESVSKRKYARLSPTFEESDYVSDFVPDKTLTDDVSHKSKSPIETTQIAFLREKNVGLMDSARKSKTKCLLLLRFLAAYIIRNDKSWIDHCDVDCECGESHKCCKAGWVAPLKKNKWVYSDKNRSDFVSVDSLARLLKDDSEIVNLLSDGEGPEFLDAIGVSAGDLLMRVATADEASRISLSKSSIQIFQALGGDIQQVTDLALEIATHPNTIKELQNRAETRRKVKRNQDVGKAVEQAIEAALGSGLGLKVKREPFGSDYLVEPENDYLDEAGNEIILEVSTPTLRFLIEIKATVMNCVRMTDLQGKKAKANPECYALCVVVLSGQEDVINEATIRNKCKFVFDIGTRITPLVVALESLEGSRIGVLTETGQIELEMQDQSVKFKVGHEVWEAGIGFDDAVRRFGGRDTSTNSLPTLAETIEPTADGQSC